jgi:hypothetical protein
VETLPTPANDAWLYLLYLVHQLLSLNSALLVTGDYTALAACMLVHPPYLSRVWNLDGWVSPQVRTVSAAVRCEHCDLLLWDAATATLHTADGATLERAPHAMYACALQVTLALPLGCPHLLRSLS